MSEEKKIKEPTTEQVIQDMLTENTGRSMLDSGGVYGRHWEKNQGLRFANSKPVLLSFKDEYIDFTRNIYHFLVECLEYSPEWQKKFEQFCKKDDPKDDKYWLDLMSRFASKYGEKGSHSGANTYNSEDLLSQVIQYEQFTFFSTDNNTSEEIVLLQIHGGCDVRGGYTEPKCFLQKEEHTLYENAQGTIECEGIKKFQVTCADCSKRWLSDSNKQNEFCICGSINLEVVPYTETHNWWTDDTYHWYEDGATILPQLETYDFSDDEKMKGKDVIYVDEDGNGYCPICGAMLYGK